MLAKLRPQVTFANVVSVLALFVALGGSSYAAIKVTGKNVENSSLTGRDVKNNSLKGSDVTGLGTGDIRNFSLLANDFKPGQLPAGAQGPRGPKGDDGADGTDGTNGATRVTMRAADSGPGFTAGGTKQTSRSCEAGERAVGAGVYTFNHSDFSDVSIANMYPLTSGDVPTGFLVAVNTAINDANGVARITVICAAP